MKKTNVFQTICLLTLLPLFCGCNDTDDVTSIFTGKTWELTFITENGKHWYPFPDITDSNAYEAYDFITGDKRFTITFTGVEKENVIDGEFTASGSAILSGTWRANAKKNTFVCHIKEQRVIDADDKIMAKIIDGLSRAVSYKGDNDNLFIHYPYNEKVNLRLAFHVKRKVQ